MKPYQIALPEARVDVSALLALYATVDELRPGGAQWNERDTQLEPAKMPTSQRGRFEISRNMMDRPEVIEFASQFLVAPTFGIFMVTYPGQSSNVHVDIRRPGAVNVVLDDDMESEVIFVEDESGAKILDTWAHEDHIPRLLNLKLWHQVINHGTKPRITFSFSFQTKFDDLVALHEVGQFIKP